MRFWDIVIVTASSERQATLYRDEIECRRLSGRLPENTQFLIVPDPGNRRMGSGGATINALGVLGSPTRITFSKLIFTMPRVLSCN